MDSFDSAIHVLKTGGWIVAIIVGIFVAMGMIVGIGRGLSDMLSPPKKTHEAPPKIVDDATLRDTDTPAEVREKVVRAHELDLPMRILALVEETRCWPSWFRDSDEFAEDAQAFSGRIEEVDDAESAFAIRFLFGAEPLLFARKKRIYSSKFDEISVRQAEHTVFCLVSIRKEEPSYYGYGALDGWSPYAVKAFIEGSWISNLEQIETAIQLVKFRRNVRSDREREVKIKNMKGDFGV